MARIKLLITDFDGTLADTFEANYRAYSEAYAAEGLSLARDKYRLCYGMRFDDLAASTGLAGEQAQRITDLKSRYYPLHFDLLRLNRPLFELIQAFRRQGGLTAVASTARRANLMAALDAVGASEAFHLILSGESVTHGKPSPEIYAKVLEHFGLQPDEALVFEDTEIGLQAAENAGISHIRITPAFYGD